MNLNFFKSLPCLSAVRWRRRKKINDQRKKKSRGTIKKNNKSEKSHGHPLNRIPKIKSSWLCHLHEVKEEEKRIFLDLPDSY